MNTTNSTNMSVDEADISTNGSTNQNSWIPTAIDSSKTKLTGTLKLDDHLEVVPRHLFRLKSYNPNAPLKPSEDHDLTIVKVGWRYLKRIDSRFDLALREPSHDDYVSGLRFLRELVNCAVNLYLAECECAIVTYVRDNWQTPPSQISSITSFDDVLRLMGSTLTEDKESPYWKNWTNVFQIYKELWDENLSNERCARSFVYRYLNEFYKAKTCPARRRTDESRSDVNGEFWVSLQESTRDWSKCAGNEPSQCGLVNRLNVRRTGKYDEMIQKTLRRKKGIVFRIQAQRRGSLPCIHTERQGKKRIIWMLLKEGGVLQDSAQKRAMSDSSSDGSSRKSPRTITDMIDDIVDHLKTQVDGNVSTGIVRELLLGIERKTGVKVEQVMASCWSIPSQIRNLDPSSSVSSITSGQQEGTTNTPIVVDGVDGVDGATDGGLTEGGGTQQNTTITPEQERLNLDDWDNSDSDDDDGFQMLIGPRPPPPSPAATTTVPEPPQPPEPETAQPPVPPTSPIRSPIRVPLRKSPRKKMTSAVNDVFVNFDKASYTMVKATNNQTCTSCDTESKGNFFSCNLCTNEHTICEECMRFGHLGCKYDRCHHNSDDSYCIQKSNKKWMSANKEKKCSKCGDGVTIGKATPLFYCLHCKLHRLCKDCWHPLSLEGSKRGRTRHSRCS